MIRGMLANAGVCIWYSGNKPMILKAAAGERMRRPPGAKRAGTTHGIVLETAKRELSTDIIFSQPIAGMHPVEWMRERREEANYWHSRLVEPGVPDQPCRRKPFAQRRAGAVKDRPGGHRMLPPAVGAFENPRSSRELISQPPGAPDAREPVGPTQLRQCGNARRLIPIAIHECEKSGHHRPLPPPPQDRRRIPTTRRFPRWSWDRCRA